MDVILKRLNELVTEANTTNSTNEKQKILAKYEDLKEILSIIYSDFEQFGVTAKNVIKLRDKGLTCECPPTHTNLRALLLDLAHRSITGHVAAQCIINFIEANKEYEEIILNALDKNLKCRIDSSLINKVFKDCVLVFDVALAKSIDKLSASAKPDFKKDCWIASRKLDGLRCLIIVKDKEITSVSRTGKEFLTLSKVKDSIKVLVDKYDLDNIVFDGEICIVDENGKENFQAIMKEYNRKNHTVENPKYCLFDCITLEDFENRKGDTLFLDRLSVLDTVMTGNTDSNLEIVQQLIVNDDESLQHFMNQATINGWEGLMIRKNVGYKGKRSNDLVKIKKFEDAEYVVKDIEVGPMRVFIEGVETEKEVMTKAVIEHKGFDVGVGSGWTPDQRLFYRDNPQELIGKTLTVQYFEESTNQDGGLSLRFPTVKIVHEIKREV